MKRTDENNDKNSEETISKLRYWDDLLNNLYIILGVMFVVSILLGLSVSMIDLLSIVACTSIGVWLLRERAEQKQRNDGRNKTSKLYYCQWAIWLLLIIGLFVSTPPDFSKPADCILILVAGGFWLGIALLIYKENKHMDK